MTRRSKPRRKLRPRARPRPRQETSRGGLPPAPDQDPLAASALRPLVLRYCKLARVKHTALDPDRYEFSFPRSERPFFRGRASVRVAFSLGALERDPEAEIAVLGSPFLSQLLEAIRDRAARLSLGLLGPSVTQEFAAGELAVPVRDGIARQSAVEVSVHPVGRLVARVVVRAGAGVEEAVIESDAHDLATGVRLDDALAARLREVEAGGVEPADPSLVADATPLPRRAVATLLELLASNLREKSGHQIAARRAAAQEALAAELARLDRYFESILADQSDPEAIATVTALRERRRTEEIRRSDVRAIVHPLQLIEASVLIQRAEWRLEAAGHHATLSTERALTGTPEWTVTCPHCSRAPTALVVCRHEHCACDACALRCSVCAEDFCTEHGSPECRVDGEPMCDEHRRECPACGLGYCTAHEGTCAEGGHAACTACLAPCASCGRAVCNRHAQRTSTDAPKGSRRLCTACLRQCEGGMNEPVGQDEVALCATCGKSVCSAHQAVCAVDEKVHCSRHLRRTDTSHRLVCARHVAACALESPATRASDEVTPCPVCGKTICARHRATCDSCGREVCTADLGPPVLTVSGARRVRRCSTCAQLVAVSTPPEAAISAARHATGATPSASGRWRVARDRSHLVVELDLGLTRRMVLAVPHGDTVPEHVIRHSVLGSKRRR